MNVCDTSEQSFFERVRGLRDAYRPHRIDRSLLKSLLLLPTQNFKGGFPMWTGAYLSPSHVEEPFFSRPFISSVPLAKVLQIPSPKCLFLVFCAEDSKGSPEPVTHLQWDDPYYDIARHHIVEVAGSDISVFSFDVFAAGLRKSLSNGFLGAPAICQAQVAMTAGIVKRSTKLLECLQYV